MGQKLHWLTVFSLTLGIAAAAPAEWREYRVSARYSGLQSWSLPEDEKYPDRAKLEANIKNGFKTDENLQVFVSKDYTELAEPTPDWQNAKILTRTHGWDESRYFNVASKLGTVGTTVTLEQHIPLGQRLLLASLDQPHEVFRMLHDKGRMQAEGIAEINPSKTQKVAVEGEFLYDYFYAGEEWIKIAKHQLLPDRSLSITRLRPDGSVVTQQVWTKPKILDDLQDPKPLWDRWEIGSSVRDVRIPGMGTPIRWQGFDAEPAPLVRRPGTSIKLAWMIPGVLLFALGVVMSAFNSLARRKAA